MKQANWTSYPQYAYELYYRENPRFAPDPYDSQVEPYSVTEHGGPYRPDMYPYGSGGRPATYARQNLSGIEQAVQKMTNRELLEYLHWVDEEAPKWAAKAALEAYAENGVLVLKELARRAADPTSRVRRHHRAKYGYAIYKKRSKARKGKAKRVRARKNPVWR